MATILRLRLVSALVIGAVAVVLPLAVLSTHGDHKVMLTGTIHFWAIWPAAGAATAAAVTLTIVGARRGDARTVLMGTSFSAMAALLPLHGDGSPGRLLRGAPGPPPPGGSSRAA